MTRESDASDRILEEERERLIPYDLPCVHCGYNLRKLNPYGLCPECGMPVIDSRTPEARGETMWRHRRFRVVVTQLLLNTITLYTLPLIVFGIPSDEPLATLWLSPLWLPSVIVFGLFGLSDSWLLLSAAISVAMATWYTIHLFRRTGSIHRGVVTMLLVSVGAVVLPVSCVRAIFANMG